MQKYFKKFFKKYLTSASLVVYNIGVNEKGEGNMTTELEKIQEYCREKIYELDEKLSYTRDVHEQIEILKVINTYWDVIMKCYDFQFIKF